MTERPVNEMKKIAIMISAFLALMLVMGAVPSRALAADETAGTEYTIRVFAGEQGTIGGAQMAEYTVAAGEEFSFNVNEVDVSGTLDEDGQVKYAPIGVHEAGKEDLKTSAFQVTGDVDLVVVYGLRGQLVQYTVHYMYGTTELGSDTYYAYDGDKAIAPWRYFDGYVPQYRNITGTVHADDPNGNNWVLPYSLAAGAAAEDETTEGGAAAPAGEGAAAGGAAAGGAAAPGAEGAAAGGEEGAGGESVTPEAPGTQDIIDIDNPEAPLAPGAEAESTSEGESEPETEKAPGGKISPFGIIGISAGGVVVAGGIIAVIIAAAKSKKRKG